MEGKKPRKHKKKLKLVTDLTKENIEEEFKKLEDVSLDSKDYNKFLFKKENLERKIFEEDEDKFENLYPNLNDPQFNIKISERQEFNDTKYDGTIENIKEKADIMCNAEFELAPHQQFVRNFLSFQTPYNSLLLYHGLGTGKTCTAISVCEEMRDYLNQVGIVQRIIIVASPNVQENFKLQLFDERKLKLIDGMWNIRACTGNKYLKEINPMNMKGLSKEKVISQIRRIINNSYLFLGYIEFANYIAKKSTLDIEITDPAKRRRAINKTLKRHFNNRLIVIDEVHNIRITDENQKKRVAVELRKLVKNVDNIRLLLLSATPMYNSYKEIIWLINLMNLNDRRAEIAVKDVFTKEGQFLLDKDGHKIGEELLMQKATGYISFVRGENPYTFPYRIFPNIFSPENTFNTEKYPRSQLNGKPIVQGLEHVNVFLTNIGEYQSKGYKHIINNMREIAHSGHSASKKSLPSFENMESFGYTMLQRPLEALNIIYPDVRLDTDKDVEPVFLVGKGGLNRIMKYTETFAPQMKKDFEYKSDKYEHIFAPEHIGSYSSKIKNVCNNVMNSDGIVLIYSQWIDGGIIPITLALEELGFTRHGTRVKSLFKKPPTPAIDAITFKPKEAGKPFHPAKYAIITGSGSGLSPDNLAEVKALTNEDNKSGEKIKVVLISLAGAEGLDFKNIRQVHIMEPWYNMNRLEQIIGRAVRTCSHKQLPFEERNVELFLHGTILDNEEEAADLYVYRLAELKSIQIGRVGRVLKKSATDCLLNIQQVNFTVENIDQTVKQKLSNREVIDYPIGDKPFSAICDYMEKCSYTCEPNKDIKDSDITMDTYNESFIVMNSDKIIQQIRRLFKEKFFFKKDELITSINVVKSYHIDQINAALTQLIEDKNEYITDKYGRLGHIVNIEKYYLFQPIELKNDNISIFDRSIPIPYKRQKLIYSEAPITSVGETVDKILLDIQENYNIATEGVDESDKEKWKKLKNNPYSFYFSAISSLHKELGISMETLHDFVLDHIMESLPYNEVVTLLNYFQLESPKNEIEEKINKYLEKQIIKYKELSGIVLNLEKGPILFVLKKVDDEKETRYEWIKAQGEDVYNLLTTNEENKKKFEINPSKLNDIVGFMINIKKQSENLVIFKIKDMKERKQKGTRCDQKLNKETIYIINQLLDKSEEKYYYYDDNKDKDIPLKQKSLCVFLEFSLRYYNKEKKDDKIWFLNPEQSRWTKIETISL